MLFLIYEGGFGGDRGSSGGSNSDMITQEDTIFIAGMDSESTEEEIAQHFGAIGVIKVKILIDNLSRVM